MEYNNKDIRDKYMEQHKYYNSLYTEKFEKLKKDENKYYDIYNYCIYIICSIGNYHII